jgi:hypothetical protein
LNTLEPLGDATLPLFYHAQPKGGHLLFLSAQLEALAKATLAGDIRGAFRAGTPDETASV